MSTQVRGVLILFVMGATAGSLLDAFHAYSHVESYAMPAFLGIAWWVPLLFGSAAVAIGFSHPFVDPLLGNRQAGRSVVSSIGELGWLVLAYVISASTLDTLAKTALLFIIYMNFCLLTGRRWQNLLLSAVTAITGTLIEMVLVAGGAFSYIHPDFIGVPFWLPCIYAYASLSLGDTGRALLSPSTTRGHA